MDNHTKPIDFTAKAKGYFEATPTLIRLFFTSDGQAFKMENAALQRAKKLKDKAITEVFSPNMSTAEIKQFKEAETAENEAGVNASFERALPELAAIIWDNARHQRR